MIKRISGTSRGRPYFEQQYIVATGIDCAMKASIFTRITNRELLLWIQDQSQSAPLLMVVGGYNGTTALNDVELISTQGKKWVKPIRPIGEVKSYLFRLRRISIINFFCRLPNSFSSGSCQGVIASGSVARQWSGSHQAVFRQLSGSHHIVVTLLSHSALWVDSLHKGVRKVKP